MTIWTARARRLGALTAIGTVAALGVTATAHADGGYGAPQTLYSGGAPLGVAVDPAGSTVSFTDPSTGDVDQIAPGGAETTVAGGFGDPFGIAADGNDDLYVGDEQPTSSSGVIRVASDGTQTPLGNVPGSAGVAVDSQGDVFAADPQDDVILEIEPDGTVTPFSTAGVSPQFVAVDNEGSVYFTASEGDGESSVEQLVLGNGESFLHTIATGLPGAEGIAVDSRGNIYVDELNAAGGTEVVAYSQAGASTVLVKDPSAQLAGGLAIDGAGDLYVAEPSVSGGPGAVVEYEPSPAPTTTTVKCGPGTGTEPETCTATVTGSSTTPSGTVDFTTTSSKGSTVAAGSCTLFNGSCSVDYTPPTTAGSFMLVAAYSGDVTNQASTGKAKVSESDLSVNVSGPSTAADRTTFTETATVANAGPTTAGQVKLTITVPTHAGLSLVNVDGGARQGNTVVFTVPYLHSGQTFSRTLTLSVAKHASGTPTITASTGLAGVDPNPSNNATSTTVTLGG